MNDPVLWFFVAFFCVFLGIMGALLNERHDGTHDNCAECDAVLQARLDSGDFVDVDEAVNQ